MKRQGSLTTACRLLAPPLVLCLFMVAPLAAGAATPTPAWNLRAFSMPTNFAPGTEGKIKVGPRFNILATNVGGADADGPIVITDTLPAGLEPAEMGSGCSALGQTVTCTYSNTVEPSYPLVSPSGGNVEFGVKVAPAAEPTELTSEVTIESPGAAPVSTSVKTTVSPETAPFGLIEGRAGLFATASEADGSPNTAAGGHPGQFTFDLGVNTEPAMHGESTTTALPSGGGLRDLHTYLPPGFVVDPGATTARCTEAQFETESCPEASALGRNEAYLSFAGDPLLTIDALYNMVPPPGAAASLGFNPLNTGVLVHVLGGLRPGDYTISATAPDIADFFNHAFYGDQLQIWGDPTSPGYDSRRGHCGLGLSFYPEGTLCPVPHEDVAALTMPTSCTASMPLQSEIDSWGDPGSFLTPGAPLTDLQGNEIGTSGCNAVPFKPTLSVQPSTNLADSPSGLDVDLKIPQSESPTTTATAHLKNATVTLPEGLVVNPSSANGLEGCSSAQVGIDPATGVADGNPVSCPEASKIGTVEVESPLLAKYEEETKLQLGPDGQVIPEPIDGSVYLATPDDNPFHSLLAIYLVLDDPVHGILVKLAGHVQADPSTGRLTTTFSDNPQLPVSDFKLRFFGGAGAALKTPLSCGTKTTTSDLTPWSTPEGADATPSDSFQTTTEPGGGACPSSDSQAPNHPLFNAGTIAPQAGAYSPLVLKLSREDGSAPISVIDTTLPEGLVGKLAGIAYCPDSSLAAAAGKAGSQEKASPSCPASSEVGTVDIGAGAGPTPYYTQGKAYLAGPYKGAPLSLAIITPATAGPYDLGTVVVRTALYVDPETTRIHAVSDPIPQILQGIPLDVRSISLKMGRPDFTLNPTSCNPLSVIGSATSPTGSSANLSNPFQVGGCSALAFKPKLALSLSGGTKRAQNPALKAVLTMPPGGANIAAASVALPHSEFLEQGHIGTICTRVQFAADQCPAGSVYGKATAVTPLLDQPLSGPVYLRSSSHELPDLVADLKGQIQVVLVGRIDSFKGGIRNTFEAVPDAPVSKFTLEMEGGKKSLLANSTNLCSKPNKATVLFDGQNGKSADSRVALKVKCKKGGKKHGKHKPHHSDRAGKAGGG